MALSYEYSVGAVRAKEKNLLSSADLEAMLACKDAAALTAYLRDKGYAEGDSTDEILKNAQADTVAYLNSVVPDETIFNVFYLVNDAHNIKAVMKGLLADVDYRKLLLTPCTVAVKDIETAVKENKYSLLPDAFAEAASHAYEVLAHTADARLSDAYIDRACMDAQLQMAKETKIAFLDEYIRTEIFYRNVKIALRACMTGAPLSYYEDALTDALDGFVKKDVTATALKGIDDLTGYLAVQDAYGCKGAMEAFAVSPTAFEKYTENLLIRLAIEKCRRSGGGAEAAIGYYLARQAEIKAIHIIAVGAETAADTAITRERLRELYG